MTPAKSPDPEPNCVSHISTTQTRDPYPTSLGSSKVTSALNTGARGVAPNKGEALDRKQGTPRF